MDLTPFFRSVLEQDHASVVLCDLNHTIIYMNPAAQVNYSKYGGGKLIGSSLLNCHNIHSVEMIYNVIEWFSENENHNSIHTHFNEKQQKDVYMIALRDENGILIGYYEKHEYRIKDTSPFYDFS